MSARIHLLFRRTFYSSWMSTILSFETKRSSSWMGIVHRWGRNQILDRSDPMKWGRINDLQSKTIKMLFRLKSLGTREQMDTKLRLLVRLKSLWQLQVDYHLFLGTWNWYEQSNRHGTEEEQIFVSKMPSKFWVEYPFVCHYSRPIRVSKATVFCSVLLTRPGLRCRCRFEL